MLMFTDRNDPKVIELLRNGAIGVLRTDTLYGIVGRADQQATVERIYATKERSEHKSPIVLIASPTQLFDTPSEQRQTVLKNVWPGKVSVIIPAVQAPDWLSRGNNSVAYRLPNDEILRELLGATGPLIAPSANPEGMPPAKSITQAKDYFGDAVDFYVDSGAIENDAPSKLIRINEEGSIERLR